MRRPSRAPIHEEGTASDLALRIHHYYGRPPTATTLTWSSAGPQFGSCLSAVRKAMVVSAAVAVNVQVFRSQPSAAAVLPVVSNANSWLAPAALTVSRFSPPTPPKAVGVPASIKVTR